MECSFSFANATLNLEMSIQHGVTSEPRERGLWSEEIGAPERRKMKNRKMGKGFTGMGMKEDST